MGAASLEACGISMAFYQARLDRRTPVLEAVNLIAGGGEFVSIVGPSGCGKTTLLQILDGLLLPTRGHVLVDGRPVDGPGRDRAVVFQDPALLPWRTVLRNVTYGLECLKVDAREARRAAEWWLDFVGLSGFGLHYPYELSGGMQQRVNLARALAVDPSILLMDEPFAALDAQTRESMQAELLAIWERSPKTVVFVTHDIGEAIFLADRVVVLSSRPGRVRAAIPVPLPRPREDSLRQGAWFRDCVGHIKALLGAPTAARRTLEPSEARGISVTRAAGRSG
jgi:NitT/TauT family transport system ATP-binding protein